MNMHILSESQFENISKALEAAQAALSNCQHVELDLNSKKAFPKATQEKVEAKPRKTRRGKRGVAVLTEAKVLEIKRQLAAGGKSVASIARDFGVHITTINCIKWGKTWKHVSIQQESTPVEVHG